MEIQGVYFDWGGVLIDDPAPGILRNLLGHCSAKTDRQELLTKDVSELLPAEIFQRFQCGSLSEDAFWEAVTRHLQLPEGILVSGLWRQSFESVYTEKSSVLGFVQKLRSMGLRTGVLSNTEEPAIELFMSRRYTFFDSLVFSCECGWAKPDSMIYRHALEKMQITAERCAFIDDKIENVLAASKMGMRTHHFREIRSLIEFFEALGVSV